ncbi:MAG: DUF429 domain-containing protein, partial [Clostridia bacterium]|nr:DUF429 domain-containing protein [Clostridia bacterium]
FLETFAAALKRARGAALILVDIPIGLPTAPPGKRGCDAAARKALKARGRSVFPAPIREVLALPPSAPHSLVSAYQRWLTGRGLPLQAYHLLPRIREVDACLGANPGLQERVRESHPELCFAALNGGKPMRHPKRTPEGCAERVELLRRYLPRLHAVLTGLPRRRRHGYAADDVLDALALAVNARLGGEGGLAVLPATGEERDACGLRMEIVTARRQG